MVSIFGRLAPAAAGAPPAVGAARRTAHAHDASGGAPPRRRRRRQVRARRRPDAAVWCGRVGGGRMRWRSTPVGAVVSTPRPEHSRAAELCSAAAWPGSSASGGTAPDGRDAPAAPSEVLSSRSGIAGCICAPAGWPPSASAGAALRSAGSPSVPCSRACS
eukprot:3886109-Prymnesium_polylepis.1